MSHENDQKMFEKYPKPEIKQCAKTNKIIKN